MTRIYGTYSRFASYIDITSSLIYAAKQDILVTGTQTADYIVGNKLENTIKGGTGDDTIYGSYNISDDRIYYPGTLYPAQEGTALVFGQRIAEELQPAEANFINGNTGNDSLWGIDGKTPLRAIRGMTRYMAVLVMTT